jgi:hypothetical protein
MIKLEHTIFHKRGVVAFAAEASSDKDLPALDLLYQSLTGKTNISCGFVTGRRLVFQVSGLDECTFKNEDGTLKQNI